MVVLDRNCHKSIEQGLMLTGAWPVYMLPTRNRYGIIGPIPPSEMDPKTIRAKAQAGSLTKEIADQKPVYAVITNSTYDGLCYNAVQAQALLETSCDRIHFGLIPHYSPDLQAAGFLRLAASCSLSPVG